MLIVLWDICAGEDDLLEEQCGVRAVWPCLRLLPLCQALLYPCWSYYVYVGVKGGTVVGKVCGRGDDVGVRLDVIYTTAIEEGQEVGSILEEDLLELKDKLVMATGITRVE